MHKVTLFAALLILSIWAQGAKAQDQTTYHERLGQRLAQLEEEYAEGKRQLIELEEQRDALEETLLRISGAIEVLREVIETEPTTDQEN